MRRCDPPKQLGFTTGLLPDHGHEQVHSPGQRGFKRWPDQGIPEIVRSFRPPHRRVGSGQQPDASVRRDHEPDNPEPPGPWQRQGDADMFAQPELRHVSRATSALEWVSNTSSGKLNLLRW